MVKQFINGEFVDSHATNTIQVLNPATNEVIGEVAEGDEQDLKVAVAGAKEAQKAWASVNRVKRAEIVLELADLMAEHKEEIAKIYQEEQGKVYDDALGEVEGSVDYIKYMAGLAQSAKGEVLQNQVDNELVMIVKKPIGVTAGIIPWNAPIFILMRKMIPALVTGCSIVVKPSEETPFGTFKIAELIQQTDIPNGLVQIVTGTGSGIGSMMSKNEDIDLISLTGSTGAGKAVMSESSANVKKVNLELGGKAPAIVTNKADLDKAVKYIVEARIKNSGQVCTCPERLYVQAGVYDDFVEKVTTAMSNLVTGDPTDDKTDFGPIINKKQLDSIDEKVQHAVENGAKVLTGGHIVSDTPGNYYEPTVVVDVDDESSIMTDEVFGPVLPIAKFDTIDEAIEKANNSVYGLSSYAFTEDLKEAMTFSERLNIGEVYINCEAEEATTGYHAGWRQSGLGGADGTRGFEEYLNTTVTYFRYE